MGPEFIFIHETCSWTTSLWHRYCSTINLLVSHFMCSHAEATV